MSLRTTYLGLDLKSPLVVSANPLTERVDNLRQMEDSGAAAVVLYSLFEEQLRQESRALFHHTTYGTHSFAEAPTFFPDSAEYRVGPDGYLEHIRRAKAAVGIPIIASLNGSTKGGWTNFARKIEEAGADALELNLYSIPTDPTLLSHDIEQSYVDIVKAVRAVVRIPVAVKLSPFFTNFAGMAKRLDDAGADGLVLFNRFYQPDIDLATMDVKPNVLLSTPQSLRLPLTWIGLLYMRVRASLAATSGVHTGEDVVKLLVVGANVTMMASALLKYGIAHLQTVETELLQWMEANEYSSVAQMRGCLSQIHSPDPGAFERAQYMKAITHFPQW